MNLPIRNWYEVGKNLGIPEYDLEIINKNKDRDHEKTCKRKMFGLWITRYTKNPTYRAIVVALGESSEQKAVKFLCQSQGIGFNNALFDNMTHNSLIYAEEK